MLLPCFLMVNNLSYPVAHTTMRIFMTHNSISQFIILDVACKLTCFSSRISRPMLPVDGRAPIRFLLRGSIDSDESLAYIPLSALRSPAYRTHECFLKTGRLASSLSSGRVRIMKEVHASTYEGWRIVV
jgi:hypothetical protein